MVWRFGLLVAIVSDVEVRFMSIETGMEIRFKSILLNTIDAPESHGGRSGQIPYSGVSMLVVNWDQ
jgi:hypothetical protein